MLIKALQAKLEKAKKDLGASSCTFYLRDPYWTNDFQLIAMSGVNIEEPMHGFLSPDCTRKVVVEGAKEIFSNSTTHDSRLREPQLANISLNKDKQELFGDFVKREKVRSSARLISVDHNDQQDAVLFVNYSRPESIDDNMQSKIHKLFSELCANLSSIRKELHERDEKWLSMATRMSLLSGYDLNINFDMGTSPSTFFNKIIQVALIELGIKDGKGLGTIYIYNAEDHMLELQGHFGPIKCLEKAKRHSVRLGQGIVSWVVLRRRAILIRDLIKSPFKRIHVPINDDVKSELAVPLEAGGELIGVMCLECTEKDAFEPGHVRPLWHAARRAALIYQLHQQVSMNKQLLELCVSTGLAMDTHAPLNNVAILAQQYLKASYCDIWRYNSDGDHFEKWGANYKTDDPPVRKGGWTEYVQRSKHPIWITKIKNKLQFSVFHWIDNKWIDKPSIDECPKELNEKLLKKNAISELGIPITMFGHPVGVAWIKYTRERLDCPKPGLMELALGFAATAGLVLDSIQRHEIDLIRKKRVDIVAEGIVSGIRSRWEHFSSGNLDIHVESCPFHSHLGGDFYAGKIIDENTYGILLLDGQGHGIEGSLHMLPLMAAFEGFASSYSTADIIHKLIATSDRLGVHGTAVYCIYSQIDGNQWLSATCAGHPSLILIRRQSGGGYNMDAFPKMNFAPLGYTSVIKEPLKEDSLMLTSGDFVVAFTDGIASEEENEFSVAVLQGRIMKVLGQYRDKTTARNIAKAVMREVKNRDKKGRLTDDATVLVVKVR